MPKRDLAARLKRSAWITATIFLVSAIALFVWLYVERDLAIDYSSYFRRIGLPTFILVITLSLTNFLLRTIRWHWYSRQQGINIAFRDSVVHYLSGFAMGVTPGRIGEVIRLWMLKADYQTPYNRGLSLLVADRVNDLAAIILLALGASLVTTGSVSAGIIVALAIAIAIYFLLMHPRFLITIVDGLYRIIGRFDRLFAGLRRSLRIGRKLFSLKNSTIAAPLSILAWFSECVGFFAILAAIDSAIPLSSATFIYAFATLVGALTFLPGGVGGFEATAILLLGASGVETAAAIIAVTVIRITTLWFSVLLGWAFLLSYLAKRGKS